jgi:hypothetical protein
VEIALPEAVWTSRGMPGTRGTCPECGGTVFRMGATHLHEGMERPQAVVISKHPRRQPPKIEPNTVYINYAEPDEETAQQIAADLNKMGLTTWLHDPTPEDVKWAGGVHPALKDCSRMVLVLSGAALANPDNEQAWSFFRQERKPIVIAQIADVPPPDDLRRAPRFGFFAGNDYKSSLRMMLQALAR